MRSLRLVVPALLVLAAVAPTSAFATVPGGIDVTCDVPRTGTPNFRSAASGQTDVKFKLWSAAAGGTQLGSDYIVPMGNLIVAKRYTERYDSVSKRRAIRINAVVGSDGSPVLLPVDGRAWLEVMVGTTTLGCDFAATGSAIARRRLQSVAFARESDHSETCDTCTGTSDISARVLHSTNTSVPTSSDVALSFDTERWDTDSIHDGINPTRLTANTAGKYLIFGTVTFATDGSGSRTLKIVVSGGSPLELGRVTVPAASTNPTVLSTSSHFDLAAGEYVELVVNQDSGGALNVQTASGSPEFGMVKVP